MASDEYLYNNAKFKFEDQRIDPALLKRYQRISPNKSIFGVRFHLFVYNLANPEKEKGLSKVFRKIGEGPVVYDSIKVKQNIQNFSKYLSDIGYTNSVVSDSLKYKSNNKINVIYNIKLGKPTKIASLTYSFEDTTIQRYIYADTSNSLIKKGMLFDKQLMQAERMRIELLLKNCGYFKFSKEYIYYNVRQSQSENLVDIWLVIKQNIAGVYNPVTRIRAHQQYIIDEILLVPETQKTNLSNTGDTLDYNNFLIFYPGKKNIHPQTLIAACRIVPGDLFSQENVDKTYSNLSDMGLFRYINIKLSEKQENDLSANNKLDCRIDLAMRKRQAYSVELMGTNTSSDLGIRGNLTFNNFNLFKGGEHLQVGVSGAIESLRHRYDQEPMQEIGIYTRLETPKFLLPFNVAEFQRKYAPRTAVQLSYNNQRQPNYIRTVANATIGYIWKGNSYNKHSLYPLDFSLVKIPRMDQNYFDSRIKGKRLEHSFIDHTILSMRYVFEFNTQPKERKQSYIYLRSSFESAGPMVNLVNEYTHWMADSLDSLFFGVKYSQYIRSDIDLRFFQVITSSNKIAYRIYGGIGIPYGNSKAMPFEKMFWSGGPYGIRAWSERSLGPGSLSDNDSIYNQLGDIKLEGNIEYRFKLFWKLEGALFADAGNVWLLKVGDKNPGEFDLKDFPKEIALGAGFGARFDLSFVLLRADLGFKIKDPARLDTGDMWIFQNENYRLKNTTFQFGIGYPF